MNRIPGQRPVVIVALLCLVAILPVWFWYSFVRDVPIGGQGDATISSRFDGLGLDSETTATEGGRLRELLSHKATALSYDHHSKTLRLYDPLTGRAFAVQPTTLKVQLLSDTSLEGFLDTIWSPNGTEVVSLFNDSGATVYRYYDYQSGRSVQLPETLDFVAFSPSGERTVSILDTSSGYNIVVSLPDGTNGWVLASTRLNIISLAWPRDDMIAFVTERTDGRRDLSTMDLDGTLETLVSKQEGLEALWSPDGSYVLLTSITDDGYVSTVLDRISRIPSSFTLPVRASRCAWSTLGDTFICGVPDYGSYAKSAASSVSRQDSVVSFDRVTGNAAIRYTPPSDQFLGVRSPVALPGGSRFAFINHFDQKPYLLTW